ncbi:MAG: hypothetical protein ACI4VP_01425 [Clostridia bacterium]
MIFIKNIFKICFVIIGTIIGAGFASGKEIYTFFCTYGFYGLFGILISNIIIGLVIFLTFKIVIDNNIKTYSDFIYFLVGSNRVLNYTINNIMNIFLLISFIVMVSGFGSYFNQEFNIPAFIGAIIISFLAFITFFKDINGIVKINSFLIPILIFLVILLGCKEKFYLFNINILPVTTGSLWIVKSILYASYNSIVLIPIIINLKNLISNKKQVIYIIFITLLFMVILSLVIFIVLNFNLPDIKYIDIPIVFIASKFGSIYKYLYGLVILIAIFTTAISEGYSFLENVSKTKKQYFVYSILICFLAIIFSNIGFGRLLDLLYPLLGYLGLLQIGILCLPHRK